MPPRPSSLRCLPPTATGPKWRTWTADCRCTTLRLRRVTSCHHDIVMPSHPPPTRMSCRCTTPWLKASDAPPRYNDIVIIACPLVSTARLTKANDNVIVMPPRHNAWQAPLPVIALLLDAYPAAVCHCHAPPSSIVEPWPMFCTIAYRSIPTVLSAAPHNSIA